MTNLEKLDRGRVLELNDMLFVEHNEKEGYDVFTRAGSLKIKVGEINQEDTSNFWFTDVRRRNYPEEIVCLGEDENDYAKFGIKQFYTPIDEFNLLDARQQEKALEMLFSIIEDYKEEVSDLRDTIRKIEVQ